MIILFCLTFGCQSKAEKAELEKFRAQAKVEEQNKAIVERVFDELNKKNAAVYQELYAPEYFWYFPSGDPNGLSRDEELGFVKLLWAGFPDIHWYIEEMVTQGDIVVARFAVTGTQTGEYQGIPPTGNKYQGSGIWMGRIKDGKIIEAKEEANVLGMMLQLGMELKPKEAKK